MLGFVKSLLKSRLDVANGKHPSVTISIPLDDPRAQTLKRIAEKLLIPKSTVRASGLTTRTGLECQENADEFLGALRQELGDELMSEIEGDLLAQINVRTGKALRATKDEILGGGRSQGAFLDEALNSGIMQEKFESSQIEKLGNIAQDLLRKDT